MNRIEVPVNDAGQDCIGKTLIIPDSEAGDYNAGTIEQIRHFGGAVIFMCRKNRVEAYFMDPTPYGYVKGEVAVLEVESGA